MSRVAPSAAADDVAVVMGYDEERRVVVCDFDGCSNEVEVPAGQAQVEGGEGWEHWNGEFRCPRHPFKSKPWLS